VYDKVFYSITAREIILEWDKTACRFVFFLLDLDLDLALRIGDLDLDLAVAGLVTSLFCSNKIDNQRDRRLKRLKAKSCNFVRDSCKFPTEKIMVAQKFNLPQKSPKVDVFQFRNGYFQKKILRQA